MSKLDDILVSLKREELDGEESASLADAKQQVKELMLELIGQDNVLFGHGEDWVGDEPQNELRREFRLKVEEL